MEFWGNGNSNMRMGKTAESKQVTFWSPEDERMFLAHGYSPELWDDYELPDGGILMRVEQRGGKWRMAELEPAAVALVWTEGATQWVKGTVLEVGDRVYFPGLKSVVLAQKQADQRRDDRTVWDVQANGKVETHAFYHHYYYARVNVGEFEPNQEAI